MARDETGAEMPGGVIEYHQAGGHETETRKRVEAVSRRRLRQTHDAGAVLVLNSKAEASPE
jgi:hypothetical protein